VLAKASERLTVRKQPKQKSDLAKFYIKILNEIEGKEQYQVKIITRLADLENLDDNVDINRTWETIRENTKFQPK
jgi:hypothetical protein